MPRSIDLTPSSQRTVPNDPTNTMQFDVQRYLATYPFSIEGLEDLVTQAINQFLEGLKAVTGIDLVTAFGHLDFSDPISFLVSLAEALIASGAALLGANSPLNALNLFNIIPQTILGFLGFNHLGVGAPNLLVAPSFDTTESVVGGGLWTWDSMAGNTSPGSVSVVADGSLKQLVSNAIPVSVGQMLNMSIASKWDNLNYTGTPISLQVLKLLNYAHAGTDTLASPVNPVAHQASWVQIAGDYTVPAGCDMICLQLTVSETVARGTVWFDDGDVHKTGNTSTFIPTLNVFGVGGPGDIGATIQSTWDQLISGFVGEASGLGAGLADMFGIGQDVSSWASLGRYSFDILGIRNNKPLDQGLLATSASNYSLGRVAMNGSAPTFAVTQGVSTIAFLRMAESNNKGVISWLGSGNASLTACYVVIWQMDTTTGDMTCVHVSPNIIGTLSASMTWVIYNMPAMLLTKAGDLYGIEITVQGTGTHTVTGTSTWIPAHPSAIPKGYAASRNSGTTLPTVGMTVIPGASVGYSANVPWVEWGITTDAGTTYPDSAEVINSIGSETIPIPDWANFVDVVALGAGAGGGGGGLYGVAQHNGGGAGQWATATWSRTTDFTAGTIVTVTVNDGGAAGATGVGAETAGGNSVVTIPGKTVTALGGSIHYGQDNGQGVTPLTYNGVTYQGGAQQNSDGGAGAVPGGGGASGSDVFGGNGGRGAHGAVQLTFRQK